MYAYDIENKVAVCAWYTGNSVDATSYNKFVVDTKLTKGVILDDKGLPVNNIKSVLEENPNLHYLTPIKRNEQRIKKFNMLIFDEFVADVGEHVLGHKEKLPDNTFLYSFRDV